ncbi:MAG: alpha-2-macroglobulin, partial [Verrucomicrobia bacterium]|nr:alpha-2-macroglobulin [Verrucomicrobiota bacterium]
GYGWFAYDYVWYPGWREWGCLRPWPWWTPRQTDPPELVAEQEVGIGADGQVLVVIDTAAAKAMHGDLDHRYEITAEVVDKSRRTIVGKGSVLVARRPFKVYAWVDRGHYRVGDTVRASFSAQTLDQKPVQGEGTLLLYRVTYDKHDKPVEKVAEEWTLATDPVGRARQQMRVERSGQYRLSYTVKNTDGHAIEGGYVFTVMGDHDDGRGYRFNALELVTDKSDYKPDDHAQLQINRSRKGGVVLLFDRAANGICLAPKVLRLDGKSLITPLEISKRDMPNFFVEALTVSDGKVHSEIREIMVPPEKRVLNIDVQASTNRYAPGQEARVKVQVTDRDGKPVQGACAISVYDKSVDYISGGSNVPEIREFFWKWRRQHNISVQSSLDRLFQNLVPLKSLGMGTLGVFGGELYGDDGSELWGTEREEKEGRRGGDRYRKNGMSKLQSAMAPMSRAAGSLDTLTEASAMEDASDQVGDKAGFGRSDSHAAVAQGSVVAPHVRSAFADTAYWAGGLFTDSNGEASVSFKMPENLTGWKIRTWAVGDGTKVGEGTLEVVTSKNLLLRLQAPRFFVETDEVVLSANIHNYLSMDKEVTAVLELDGGSLAILPGQSATQMINIASQGEGRVDWRVNVLREGLATVRMKALTDEESDAMQTEFPVYVHGMLKTDSFSGQIRPEDHESAITFTVPHDRRPEQSRLEVRYSPSLAMAMVDALPYLVDYPYGCTEQTLNRFVPTVLTRKILLDIGVDLESVRQKRSNLNAQEIGDDAERAAQWKRYSRSPVFDEARVRDMVREGVERLQAMQLSDGGWGWFSGWGEHAYAHTTVTVVHGLQVARNNDALVPQEMLDRGLAWLQGYEAKEVKRLDRGRQKAKTGDWKSHADDMDAAVCLVLAEAGKVNLKMLDYLYADRTQLSVYAKSMLGMVLHQEKRVEELAMVMRNIEQYLVEDEENQTAYLKLPNEGYWWTWYGSEYEAHAYYLKLLARTDPGRRTGSWMVKYLLNNRKHATYWKSTRDTALCLEAFGDYIRATGEDAPNMTVEMSIDGKKVKVVQINKDNLFTYDNQLVLSGPSVTSGEHTLSFVRKGAGPLYFNAYVSNFTIEKFITKAGLEVNVERKVYRLDRAEKSVKVAGSHGQALGQRVEKFIRTELKNEDTLKSGDLVEIELIMDSKNDYEYILVEDMKASGFEPVDVRSGYTDDGMHAYVEYRDEKVAFFVRALARGRHSVSYRLRAEIPGKFSALPARISAMYAPELKGNSNEIKLVIED